MTESESNLIERMARAGYECSAWKHKQPWDKNPWAQDAWRKCAAEMLAASAVGAEPCPVCQGRGLTVLMPDGHEVECSQCEGTG